MAPSGPFSVTVHPFESKCRGSAAYEVGLASARNAIVFIGGLTDGPHTIPYTRLLAQRLEEARDLGYSVIEFRMRSSFSGFGTSSLSNDVEDISALVKYLRGIGKERIVLFGSSTGCQVSQPPCHAYHAATLTRHRTVSSMPTTQSITTSPWMAS